MKRVLVARFAAALPLVAAKAEDPRFGSGDLIEKARAEGKIVLYPVNFNETEHAWIVAFKKRFAFIQGRAHVRG